MTLGTILLACGITLLAAALIATVVCVCVGIGKKKKLDQYFEEWY